MLAVPLQTEPQFSAGKPRVLSGGAFETMDGARNYDVTPDGQRFIMVLGGSEYVERPTC